MTKTLRFNHYSSLYGTDKVGLVNDYIMRADETYGKQIKEQGKEGIWLFEQDIIMIKSYFDQAKNLIECNRDTIIAFPYYLYPITTKLPFPVIAHRKIAERGADWISMTTQPYQWADLFGLGCTYLPSSIVDLVDESWDYPTLDSDLSMVCHQRGIRALVPMTLFAVHYHI